MLWNPTTRQMRQSVTCLIDSGAGGGDYASAQFIKTLEQMEYGGRNMVSVRGRGNLRAANPHDSDVPPMKILGTCLLSMVFPPEDGIFRVRVRVTEGLPFALILGAAFMRKHGSILLFEGAGWFMPTPTSSRVSQLPWNAHQGPRQISDSAEDQAPTGWQAAPLGSPSGRVRDDATGEVIPPEEPGTGDAPGDQLADMFAAFSLDDWEYEADALESQEDNLVPEVAAMAAVELGSSAWEDESTLRWPVTLDATAVVRGRVSVEVDVKLTGPQPNKKQLLLIFPVKPFDLDSEADIGVNRGVVWWTPGKALKVKLTNKPTHPNTVKEGTQVATAYATSCDDVDRMLLFKESLPTTPPADSRRDPPPTDAEQATLHKGIRVSDANTGQLGPESRERLLRVIDGANDWEIFPENPKMVPPIVKGREVHIELKDPHVTPVACRSQRFNPMTASMVNKQVELWYKSGAIRTSTSSWCSPLVLVDKADKTTRFCIDYRAVNRLTKSDSGGLGDLSSMHNRTHGSNFYTVLDLPQAFHQMIIHEDSRQFTAFRDGSGRLWEFNVCSFGLQNIPAVFSAQLGDTLRGVWDEGVEKWLDDILLHSKTL